MRYHRPWPHWLWGKALRGSISALRVPPILSCLPPMRLTWPGLSSQHGRRVGRRSAPLLRLGLLSSPPYYWKGFRELEARFTQSVHHGNGGGLGKRLSAGALTGEGGGDGGAENPTVGVHEGQPGAAQPAKGPTAPRPMSSGAPLSSTFVFTAISFPTPNINVWPV